MNALARQHTAAAIEALVKSLGERRTRVQAAQALLDRGWGKPMQAVELATPDVVMSHQFSEALDRLSCDELEQLVALYERMGIGLEGAERSAGVEANIVKAGNGAATGWGTSENGNSRHSAGAAFARSRADQITLELCQAA